MEKDTYEKEHIQNTCIFSKGTCIGHVRSPVGKQSFVYLQLCNINHFLFTVVSWLPVPLV